MAVVVCTLPRGGGLPVGASTGMAVKTRWRPLGSWAPSRKNLGFAGGDSAIRYGTVWYGMVWYGMVRYGMVRYGTVRYGVVWYDTVRYGMLCETEAGWGRDGGTTCPGTCGAPVPLASSRRSPATGEGATSCAVVE